MPKKQTSLVWYVVGILVYVEIFGIIAEAARYVPLVKHQLDNITVVVFSYIANIIIIFAVGSYASWRYELPSSPMRVALTVAVTRLVLSIILVAAKLLLLVNSPIGAAIIDVSLFQSVFNYEVILPALVRAFFTGTVLFLTLTYFSTRRSQPILS